MIFTLNGYAPMNVLAKVEADTEEQAREQFEEMLAEGNYIDPRGGFHFNNTDIEISDILMDDYNDEHTIVEDIEE